MTFSASSLHKELALIKHHKIVQAVPVFSHHFFPSFNGSFRKSIKSLNISLSCPPIARWTIFVVERAVPPEKKAYPNKSLIVVVSTLASLLFALIVMIVIDNVKSRVAVIKEG